MPSLSCSEQRYSHDFCSALLTHPSQILWTESSGFTQVEVPPARKVKITCDFKENLSACKQLCSTAPAALLKLASGVQKSQHQ